MVIITVMVIVQLWLHVTVMIAVTASLTCLVPFTCQLSCSTFVPWPINHNDAPMQSLFRTQT